MVALLSHQPCFACTYASITTSLSSAAATNSSYVIAVDAGASVGATVGSAVGSAVGAAVTTGFVGSAVSVGTGVTSTSALFPQAAQPSTKILVNKAAANFFIIISPLLIDNKFVLNSYKITKHIIAKKFQKSILYF